MAAQLPPRMLLTYRYFCSEEKGSDVSTFKYDIIEIVILPWIYPKQYIIMAIKRDKYLIPDLLI